MAAQPTPTDLRARIIADITDQTGITEAMIEQLVQSFYARIRKDTVLGPVFAARITDWNTHTVTMVEFWSSVALMSGRYHGNPMAKHKDLPVDIEHFGRWLALFEEAVVEICPPAAQAHFMDRAQRIAQSLSNGIADHARRSAATPILTMRGGHA
jgi:hemoglobin